MVRYQSESQWLTITNPQDTVIQSNSVDYVSDYISMTTEFPIDFYLYVIVFNIQFRFRDNPKISFQHGNRITYLKVIRFSSQAQGLCRKASSLSARMERLVGSMASCYYKDDSR